MLLTRVDADRLDLAAQVFHTGRAVGIVLVGQWQHHDQLNAMAVRGVPFVVWGAQLPQQLYATVGGDNLQGGRLATRHLLAEGARHIVFLGDPALPEVALRQRGYFEAHADAGVAVDPRLCRPVPFVTDRVGPEIETLLAQVPEFDAVFAASDVLAMAAISSLRRLGRSVPESVLVAGYDDIALAEHFHPPLTSVAQPIDEAGRLLVQLLLAQLAGGRVDSRQLQTELRVRQSSQR
jgi:DNA-binding LacI/PurR family transcriptional regulator